MPPFSQLIFLSFGILFLAQPTILYSEPAKTRYEGMIVFRDETGVEVETPVEVERLEQFLSAELKDHQSPENTAYGFLPVTFDEEPDEELKTLVTYNLTLNNLFRAPPVYIDIDYNFGGYDLDERLEIRRHRGDVQHHLIVTRYFPNRDARINEINRSLAIQPLEPNDWARVFRMAVGLSQDDMLSLENGAPNLSAKFEDYRRIVDILRRMIQSEALVTPQIVSELRRMEENGTFLELEPKHQFKILAGVGRWMSKSKTLDQPISPDLTYYQLAQQFFQLAANLARSDPTKISASDSIRMLQEWYFFECEHGLPEDCFYTLKDAADIERRVDVRSYASIIKRFATELELLSGIKNNTLPEPQFRRKIACNSDLVFYWGMYNDTANLHDKMSEASKSTSNLRLNKERAEAIIVAECLEVELAQANVGD